MSEHLIHIKLRHNIQCVNYLIHKQPLSLNSYGSYVKGHSLFKLLCSGEPNLLLLSEMSSWEPLYLYPLRI